MADEMFFSKDEKSLIRGSRSDPRTETCRPCVVELDNESINGVVLDVTPRGMLVRMLEPVAINTNVTVQLMRDEQFQKKMSTPHVGTIVRIEATSDGFYDHGLHLEKKAIPKASQRPVSI
ncbi:MAG: PilZ domain-containing protein [Candidatus Hydrogenedentota bacterium]